VSASRYPLSWPAGWKRTPAHIRKGGKFGVMLGHIGTAYKSRGELTISEGVRRVLVELGRLGVAESSIVISSNLKTRRDGFPLSDQREPDDSGVAVYWNDAYGNPRAMACDLYTRSADNLAAIAASLEAMRAIERHGGAQILNRVFRGFEALPAPKSCWEILHILPTTDRDTIERAYRVRALQCHPDRGGTDSAMAELNDARQRALEHH
jgi:hypothetical protein